MKTLPFSADFLRDLVSEYPTPFHIYTEAAIRENARRMKAAFGWVPAGPGARAATHPDGYCNFFAVKALPNPHVMRILREEGMGFDCSSYSELLLAEMIGARGEEIMFTSNDTPRKDYAKALELGAILNLDDITHIDYLAREFRVPDMVCMRYNPGSLKEGNVIIGKPEEAKYGFTRDQLFDGYARARDLGATRFGLHTMVASNELNADYFVETAEILFDLAVELKERLGIRLELINLGGGVGIPYHPDQTPVDFEYVSSGIRAAYEVRITAAGLHPIRVVSENGRVVTGPYGYLVSSVIHMKETYKHYVGLDATMANLMRPGMYGAYHHVTVAGKEGAEPTQTYDVTGSLCENNDKFAIDRRLPPVEVGDLLVIHDTGAHGHSMGFNYNGKLRSAELLLKTDGTVEMIRRPETVEDLFATIVWDE